MVKKHPEADYDFVIIGAGVTGLAAAMYSARLGMKTLCLGTTFGSELPIGGVITTTNVVENYPGFIKLTGGELAENIKKHAESYKEVTIKEEKVLDIVKKKGFVIKTNKGEYHSRAILIATGTKWRKLDVPGSKEFENKGVAYCALCDGPLFKGKVVGVVGGSDSAIKDALVLSGYAKKVYIIYRGGNVRAEPVNLEIVKKTKNIEIINNTNVVEIKGDKFVTSVTLDKPHKGKKDFALEGLFVAIGHISLSDLGKKLGTKLNKAGEIMIDHKTSTTSVEGIYAAGDVTEKPFKQAITGVADGCTAAYSAYEYITKNKIEGV